MDPGDRDKTTSKCFQDLRCGICGAVIDSIDTEILVGLGEYAVEGALQKPFYVVTRNDDGHFTTDLCAVLHFLEGFGARRHSLIVGVVWINSKADVIKTARQDVTTMSNGCHIDLKRWIHVNISGRYDLYWVGCGFVGVETIGLAEEAVFLVQPKYALGQIS